eukprot:CAMPEP_0194272022 /NCGR_PEP_ID=MMETSP0169-20130528/5685_1 /TAXON_ID=218684 /ORGANISM="Corethron pennatum, Strain L29A3" /LENGTH=113 /DNA_ID=CAMNT_0039014563 /DNA_START=128 /DNA_END=466 /DNA_ORIENTATION=+
MKTSRATSAYVAFLTISMATGQEQNGTSIVQIMIDTISSSPTISPTLVVENSLQPAPEIEGYYYDVDLNDTSLQPPPEIGDDVAFNDASEQNTTDSLNTVPVQNMTGVPTLSN